MIKSFKMAEHEDGSDGSEEVEEKIVKKPKKMGKLEQEMGIIYLSRIPPYMSVKKIRHMFRQHGELGRIFLQPNGKCTYLQGPTSSSVFNT